MLLNKIGIDEAAIVPKLEQAITASYKSVIKDTTAILAEESLKNVKLETATAKKKALSKARARIKKALSGLATRDVQQFNERLTEIWG